MRLVGNLGWDRIETGRGWSGTYQDCQEYGRTGQEHGGTIRNMVEQVRNMVRLAENMASLEGNLAA